MEAEGRGQGTSGRSTRTALASRTRGRPSKLTDELAAAIVEAVRRGNYLETAAALAGLDPATLRRWVKRGADEPESAYGRLADAIRQAQAESEDHDLAALALAADGGVWQARAWRLERRFPERWARRARHEHTGPGGGPIQHAHVHMLVQTVVEVLGKYVDANRFDAAVAELGALMDDRVPRGGDGL